MLEVLSYVHNILDSRKIIQRDVVAFIWSESRQRQLKRGFVKLIKYNLLLIWILSPANVVSSLLPNIKLTWIDYTLELKLSKWLLLKKRDGLLYPVFNVNTFGAAW